MSKNFLILNCILVVVFKSSKTTGCSDVCGKVDIVSPTVLGGESSIKGQWPFLAALFEIENGKFFCGGTLITARHVMTAAHCVHFKHSSGMFAAEDVIVFLGAYNLTKKIERGSVQKYVTDIHVHPDWRTQNDRFDADIAILVLTDNVILTQYIRPVCLPANENILVDAKGSIAGWGFSDSHSKKPSDIPQDAFVFSVNDTYCYTTDPIIASISSSRTFCGSSDGNSSPNNGDSGGGMFWFSGSSWVQLGIISAVRLQSGETGSDFATIFSIYTKVKTFDSWIIETIAPATVAYEGAQQLASDEPENQKVSVSLPQWISMDSSTTALPMDCHIGGYENNYYYKGPIYIGRKQFPDQLVIGKYNNKLKELYVIKDEVEEDILTDFEVYCGGRIKWVPLEDLNDTTKLVQGGYDSNGRPSYICRANFIDRISQTFPGSYIPSEGCCQINVRGSSICSLELSVAQVI